MGQFRCVQTACVMYPLTGLSENKADVVFLLIFCPNRTVKCMFLSQSLLLKLRLKFSTCLSLVLKTSFSQSTVHCYANLLQWCANRPAQRREPVWTPSRTCTRVADHNAPRAGVAVHGAAEQPAFHRLGLGGPRADHRHCTAESASLEAHFRRPRTAQGICGQFSCSS